MSASHSSNIHKFTLTGFIVSLGIIYGDIGTSPLYVMSAIIGEKVISPELVLGGISAVFWTITLLTTFKYVMITLQADNNGEGGIFSLFALVKRKRKKKYLIWVAIIGGSMLLADGIITPPISVASAIEGMRSIYPEINTVPIIIGIIVCIFLLQRFGTANVGKSFGPIMVIWFSMLTFMGIRNIVTYPEIVKAIYPIYAWNLITQYPHGFWLLGAVFLCATGAEALYSDLGHVGRNNIRTSWVIVKLALIINYFGQGAFLMQHTGEHLNGNPFFMMMPKEFTIIGVIIATMAAIIASQALITGSFSLISESIRLNLFPKVEIKYPSSTLGQIYIPFINWFLMIGCIVVVMYFQKASNMEAAYGLAITVTMIMTTLLLREYLLTRRKNFLYIWILFFAFLAIEFSFFIANIIKFKEGGYITLLISILFILIMYSRNRTVKIKNELREYSKIDDYVEQFISLSKDQSLPKYATNLVFLTTSPREDEIEYKIAYSILQKQPKRADIYWFVHIAISKNPRLMEYKVETIAKDDVYRITFYLGFKIEERISQFLRYVIEDMVKKGEVNIASRYHSLREHNIAGDFRFVLLEEILSSENELGFWDKLAININLWLKSLTATPEKWFGLDTNLVTVEKVPLIIRPTNNLKLTRIYEKHQEM